ncbi:MAG TPA: hypothetical protein VJ889_30915, partial [Pseudomonas sp.]|nr:hypothetical protein [Pseudomonas sp.]
MAENDNFLINRSSLAKFLPDNDTIRRFEKLFQAVNVTTPINLEIIFTRLDELLEGVGNADMRAGLANDLIAAVRQDIDLLVGAPLPDLSRLDVLDKLTQALESYAGTIDVKANQIGDSLHALAREIESAVSNPQFNMPRSFPVDYLDFDQNPAAAAQVARVEWNPTDDTLNIHHSNDVTQQVGQELYGRITNNSGATIPNGAAVSFEPATNSFLLFIADGTIDPLTIIGIATEQILNGAQGRLTVWGRVRNID